MNATSVTITNNVRRRNIRIIELPTERPAVALVGPLPNVLNFNYRLMFYMSPDQASDDRA